jgi:predicted esterase
MTQAAQLVRLSLCGREPIRGTLLILHATGARLEDLAKSCAEAMPAWNVCAPRAPRSINPFQTGGETSLGPPAMASHRGFGWLRRDPDGRVDPASLGDALAELEHLVAELEADQPGLPIIVIGEAEGGALARLLSHRLRSTITGGISFAAPQLEIPDDKSNRDGVTRCVEYERRLSTDALSSLVEKGITHGDDSTPSSPSASEAIQESCVTGEDAAERPAR